MDTQKEEAKQKGKNKVEEPMSAFFSLEDAKKKGLNPFAKEWDPIKDRSPEELRCLYLAFSCWYPLHEEEITFFFHQMFGDCVEKMNIVESPNEDGMVFGKVVFRFSAVPAYVLAKEDKVVYFVNSKCLWCLRFDPLMNQNMKQDQNAVVSPPA